MSYFSSFNYIQYPSFTKETSLGILKDITSRVVRTISPVDDSSLFYKYTIKENNSIEDISLELYNTPIYYWIIMLINNRFDRFYDFPLTELELSRYIIEKYGSINYANNNYKKFIRLSDKIFSNNELEDKNNYIEISDSFIVAGNSYTYDTYPLFSNGIRMKFEITLYDYEIELNESKRNILILNRSYLTEFVREFKNLISR
jgi:hypothetical protein